MFSRKPETDSVLAAGMAAWAASLQVLVFLSAGPLWRDEAWSAAQARLPGWPALWESLRWDSFPPLYPALLRLLVGAGAAGTDSSLRVVGLLTSACFLALLVAAARIGGRTAPAPVALLVGTNAVLAWEIAAVRPYGLALLGVLAAWVLMARSAERVSATRIAAATVAAVVAVQVSYVNAVHVAALCTAAAVTGSARRGWRGSAALLIPGGAAALSLLPYAPILSAAREWTVLLRYDPDWPEFLRRLTAQQGWVIAVLWLVAGGLALGPARPSGREPSLSSFASRAAAFSLAGQIALIHAARLPLFPRYFLPVLLMAGLALGFRLARLSLRARVAFVVLGALSAATPTWQSLSQRRTNADLAAAFLGGAAGARDLVLISPWFLHPSFARYYGGDAEWRTVPEVGQDPGVRYDRIRDLMTGSAADVDVGVRISETFDRGGRVWLLSQRYPSASEPLRRPPAVTERLLDGHRYSEFRNYWERNVEVRLLQLATGSEIPLQGESNVWREEKLVVSCWRRQAR